MMQDRDRELRRKNVKLALTLASVALIFALGFVLKRALIGV
ncbi:cytochrome oxidase small assembly protein [Hydrogenophaga sp. 5NK40-0174]